MTKVTIVDHRGAATSIDWAPGESLMRAIVSAGVPGVVGECGGAAMCATCHVYISPDDLAKLPPPGEIEAEMLSATAADRLENSRLSCQITGDANLESLTLQLPDRQ